MMTGSLLTDQMWEAIVENDSSFDGKFYYAVRTTGIFCRPSCKSKSPAKTNVQIFSDAQQALLANFRPCKRCKPEGRKLPDEEWVGQLVQVIEDRYAEPLSLTMLAEIIHGSPFHLQRTFKRIMGVTPFEYIQHTRISKAKQYLTGTDTSVMEIGITVGIPNAGHFATVFQKRTGRTPSEYRALMGRG